MCRMKRSFFPLCGPGPEADTSLPSFPPGDGQRITPCAATGGYVSSRLVARRPTRLFLVSIWEGQRITCLFPPCGPGMDMSLFSLLSGEFQSQSLSTVCCSLSIAQGIADIRAETYFAAELCSLCHICRRSKWMHSVKHEFIPIKGFICRESS
jgi:hypothetical protein